MRLIDRLGFDPVDAGPLANGAALQPDGSPVAATYGANQLAKLCRAKRRRQQVTGS
jgi:predicted dinucleotide-binding enzyme